ncbi:MAG: PAS domain S-box protein [bacterium]|nr:MAG: PAS domain S-box protein [bacterium]
MSTKKTREFHGELEALRKRISELEQLETRHKLADNTVKESEEKFRALFDSASDAIFIHDLDGRFVEVNKAATERLGYSRDELLEMTPVDIDSSQFAALVPKRIEELKRERHLFLETAHVTKDGAAIPIELSSSIIEFQGRQMILSIARDITERRDAERLLRENKEKYSSLFHQSNDSIIVHDLDGNIIDVNTKTLELFGYDESEIFSLRIIDLYPSDMHEISKRAFDRITREGHISFEIDFMKKDGEVFPAEVSSSMLEIGGKPVIQGVVRDITEKKKGEEELRESKEMYETLVLASPLAVSMTDLEGRITYVSPRTLALLGFDRVDELIGRDALELITEKDQERAKEILKRILKERYNENIEYTMRRKDGTTFIGEANAALVLDAHANPKAIIITARDITERKNEEIRLRESEEKFRTLAEKLPNMIFINKGGRVVYANERCSEVTGYTREEFYSPHFDFFCLIAPENKDLIVKNFRSHMAGQDVNPHEYAIITKGGRYIDALLTTKLINYEGERAILGIITDLTERKELERRLNQSQKMEAIGQLAGGVAHDFNNILIGIMGYSDLLLNELGDGNLLCGDVEEIKKAAERAASLTRQLLVFGSKEMLQTKVVNINDVISNMHQMLERFIGEDIELTLSLDPDLKPVKADPAQIEVSLINLAVNARDAMPEGGQLTIKTDNVVLDENACNVMINAKPGNHVRVSVRDTGMGIEPELLDRIFEPFFTTKSDANGTGMGLATVYGSIKQHGGCISATSTPGSGSTFEIYIPATGERKTVEDDAELPLTELQGNGECILLVEDESGVRSFTSRALRENGYTVLEAHNTEEGLQIFQQERDTIELVFSDVVLPGKTGIKLIEELTSMKPRLKVIMSSGYTKEKSHWELIRERGFRFVQKPYSLVNLLTSVKETLATG